MTDCSNVAKRDRQRDFALDARAGARLTALDVVAFDAVDAFAGFEPFVALDDFRGVAAFAVVSPSAASKLA